MRKERFKAYRLKRDYTQESLAFELQTDKRQITRWENGESDPSADKLVDIARVLTVSVDYLLGVSDNPSPHFRPDSMSEDEIEVVAAMRRGEPMQAIKIIASR